MLWRTNPNCPNLLLEGSRVITALSDLYSRQVLAAASGRRAPWSQMCLVDWRDKLPIRSAEQCDKHHYTKETRCVKRMSRGEDGYGVYMSALQDCISFSLEKSGLPGQNAYSRDNRQRKHLVDYIASQIVSLAHQNRPKSERCWPHAISLQLMASLCYLEARQPFLALSPAGVRQQGRSQERSLIVTKRSRRSRSFWTVASS